MNRRKTKRKTKVTRAAAIAMTVVLTAFTLVMSGCSTGTASDTSDASDKSAASAGVTWEYVSPSDLQGDTAKTDADANTESEPSSGEAPSGQPPSDSQTPPEKPDGDMQAQGGQPPEMPNGEAPSGEPPTGQPPSGAPGGGPDTANYDYSGDVTGKLTADGKEVTSDGETIESTTADENVLLAQNGGVLKVTDADITKSGDDSNGDNCNFYGINSSVLSTGEGSEVYLSDSKINSTGEGNNGVFATDGGTAYLNKVEINTTKGSNSRGLDATYGGVIYGNDLAINTAKDHCAALATDRGGGYVSVTNSTLETAGNGSPLIY